MFNQRDAIKHLNEYGIAFDQDLWNSKSTRNQGEFGVFAVIIRVIAGLFILAMTIVAIAGFIALLGLDNNWEIVTAAIGVLATGFAAWKFRHSYRTLEKQYSFKGLLYLSLLLVGKACLLVALFTWFGVASWRGGSGMTVAVVFAAITLASCFYYRMYLEAFLAILVSLYLLDVTLSTQLTLLFSSGDTTNQGAETLVQDWTGWRLASLMIDVMITGLAGFLIWYQRKRYISSVYLYALLVFLAYRLLPGANHLFWHFSPKEDADAWAFDWGMFAFSSFVITALYASLIGGWRELKSSRHLTVVACIFILAVGSVYGVLFAVALMAMGHVRHDRFLWVFGLIYLPVYLFNFYFILDMTLLVKSYMLLGSGAFVLAARYILLHFIAPSLEETEGDHA